METIPDPFREARNEAGVLECEFQDESVPMILRHEDVRRAAKDWKTFSSDAPLRVENESAYQRVVGYESLTVRLTPR